MRNAKLTALLMVAVMMTVSVNITPFAEDYFDQAAEIGYDAEDEYEASEDMEILIEEPEVLVAENEEMPAEMEEAAGADLIEDLDIEDPDTEEITLDDGAFEDAAIYADDYASSEETETEEEDSVFEMTDDLEEATENEGMDLAEGEGASFDTAIELHDGDAFEINIGTEEQSNYYYKYTPETDQIVVARSASDTDADPYIDLYLDDNGSPELIENSDDEGGNYQFLLYSELIAGETYYYKIGSYGESLITFSFETVPFHAYAASSTYVRTAPNSEVTLEVGIKGKAEGLTYKWTRFGEATDATTGTYTFNATDSGTVTCEVSDGSNTDSVSFSINVEHGFDPHAVDNEHKGVEKGNSCTLSVEINEDFPEFTSTYTYAWFIFVDDEDEYKEIEGATGASLDVTPSKSTEYYCRVTDEYGLSMSVYFDVTVIDVAGVIKEAEKVNVTDIESSVSRTYKFIPTRSLSYYIFSEGNLDTYLRVSDQNYEQIGYDDNGSPNNNFGTKVYMEAGKTYYLSVGLYEEDGTKGSFSFIVADIVNNVIQTPSEGTPKPTPTPTPAPAHTHSYGAWTVTKAATALAEGVETRKCSCGDTQTRVIAKLAATISLNVSGTVPMKQKQSSKVVKVSDLAEGDYVASVKSNKTNIVKVTQKNGTLTLKAQKKTGTATITVTLASGTSKSFKVKVQKAEVKTKKIKVAAKSKTLKAKEKFDISAVLTPLTSQEKITYTTSNKKVATVSKKGVIQGKKKGKATITVKSGSKKVSIKITVK